MTATSEHAGPAVPPATPEAPVPVAGAPVVGGGVGRSERRRASTRRSVAGNAGSLMASQLLTFGLGAVVMVLLPRSLGPEALGQLRLAQSLWAIAAIVLSFGTSTLLSREVARDRAAAGAIVGPTLLMQLVLFAALLPLLAAYVVATGSDPTFAAVLALIGVGTLLGEMGSTGRSALYGLERMDLSAVADIGGKVLYVAAVLGALALGAGVVGAAGATALYGLVLAIALLGMVRRSERVPVRARLRDIGPIMRQGRPFLLVGAIMVVYQQVDVVVISLLVDEETIGWYATSDALLGSLLFLPVILSTAVFPHVARLHQEEPAAVPALLRRTLAYTTLLAVPIGLGALAVAGPLVVQLFGAEFERSGPVLAVSGVVLIIMHLTIVLGRFAMAIDRQALWIRLMAIATVLSVALDLVLVPLADARFGNGAVGGALAYVATEGMLLVVGIRTLAPGLVDAELARRVLKVLAAGLVMVAAVWPLRELPLVVPIAAGAATYVLAILASRWFSPADVAELRALLSGVARRRPRSEVGSP